MSYLQLFGIGIVLSIISRLFIVFLNRTWFAQGFVGDSSVHFGIIKQLKKDSKSRFIEQYLISPEPMSYPLAFHRFAMLFPLSTLRKYSYLPNLLIFSSLSSLFLVYLHYLEREVLGREDYLLLIIAGTVYYISVSNLVFRGPAIAYIKLSERLLARMSCSFYFLALSVGVIWDDYFSLGFSSLFGALALVSSIFARQAVFFIVPLLSVLFLDVKPIISLVVIVILAFLFSRDHFLRGLKHTFLTWKLYATHTKKSASVRNALSKFINFSFLIKTNSIRRIIGHLIRHEPSRTIFFYPELVLIIALVLFSNVNPNILIKITTPLIATFIIYLITSTERFNHLGEAYRYIEYSLYFILPTVVALISLNVSIPVTIYSLSVYGILILLISGLMIMFYRDSEKWPKRDKLADFLSDTRLSSNSVVFPITMRLGADICARTEFKSFWWQPGIISANIYNEFVEEYPFLKKNWSALFAKYNVTHVICDKSALQQITWQYNFSELKLIREDEHYRAYAIIENCE